ncbi:Cytochrome P450 2J6 [Colletotrichum higginsianum]|nr:Cytochrome P450 2J6 [Colletotrichum higginsianum]
MLSLAKHATATGEPMDWFRQQAMKHNSPLCQVFVRPFAPPIVLLSDFREVQNMMLSRNKEFDRSRIFRDILGDAGPHHHIMKKTGPEWANQRKLLNDLMTPRFMHTVAAPHIYAGVESLIELWEIKIELAEGRPFDADLDAYYLALDAVVAFSYGASYPHRALLPQIDLLRSFQPKDSARLHQGSTEDAAIRFPEAKVDRALKDTLTMVKTAEVMQASVVPRLTWWWLSKTPKIRNAWKARDEFVAGQIQKAVERMHSMNDAGDEWLGNAVDLIVSREREFAKKEDRIPQYVTQVIIEEVFGFTMAGHESSSSTILWALKYITSSPEVQEKLRILLRRSHSAAFVEKRAPTVEEIIRARIPYLDAVMDEVLRLGSPIPFLARDAETDDAEILGVHIPKGTIVFAHTLGPSMTSPKIDIEDKLRHPASEGSKTGEWSPEDVAIFRPERWLTLNETTQEEEYNPNAGPFLSFGLGQRGCFGRRLGLFEFRISLTLLLWHFEFLPVPEALSGLEARDALTRRPKHAVVKARKLSY